MFQMLSICRIVALIGTVLFSSCGASREAEISALRAEEESYKSRSLVAIEERTKLEPEVQRLRKDAEAESPESLAKSLQSAEAELLPMEAELSALRTELSGIENFTSTVKQKTAP